MMKEHERRERLKGMSGEERRREEQHHEEMKKKHAEHPKVNHPVRLRTFLQAKRVFTEHSSRRNPCL